ncbi:hypothetical protein [Phytohabitans rumicis]|uniref:ABC transporter n=1 Tax=Phytohabitans rumicis TaxID=1076125 RepID=A0A6V8LJD6_9ACTN|nr:hypothetical protein [Phytohabitans rumicis]GFJ95660.1 ABC transporter [Phytohabitans rumicis]
MSTAILERREATAGPAAGDPRRAMLALARFESLRLLRHPVTVIGVLLFIAPWLYGWISGRANRYPVLQEADWSNQFLALLTLGGAALVATNLAALRAYRHRTTAQYDVLVLPASWRTGAFLLSVVPFAAVVAVLVGVRVGGLALLPGAAGRINPYELAAYPAVVLLLGAVGVLLARLVRMTIVAPLVLLALVVATFAGVLAPFPGARQLKWLLPISVDEPPMPLPVDLMTRPAGRHLAYVVGLVVVVAVAALAVAGARGRRLLGTAAVGLAVAVLAGSVQLLPVSGPVKAARAAAVEQPATMQTCRRIEQVTYCAFDDFAPWIGAWDTVVRGVLRAVPEQEARRPLAVRQRVSIDDRPVIGGQVSGPEDRAAIGEQWRRIDAAAGTPNAVTVGTQWGDAQAEVELAGLVAYEVVARKGPGVDGTVCGARGVLTGWLAGQATPKAAAGLRELDANSSGGVTFFDPSFSVGMWVPDREMAVARALLQRPAAEVAEVVRRSWAELSAAETPAERVGEIFGVPVPPLPPVQERTVCTA